MKRYGTPGLLVLCFLAAALLGGCSEGGAHGDAGTGKPKAPSFSAQTLTGSVIDPAAQTGKVVLVDFWATWCPPCRDSIPVLQRLHEKYGGQGLVILGVSNEEPEIVARFVADQRMTYAVAASPSLSDALRKYEVEGLPTTVLIDKQGRVRSFEAGFAPGAGGTEAKLEALIPKLLAEQ